MAAILENQVATGATAFFPGSQSQQAEPGDNAFADDGDDEDEASGTEVKLCSLSTIYGLSFLYMVQHMLLQ